MYVYVMDKTLKRIGLIDNYVSVIWTSRYYQAGDFELYLPVTDEFIELLQVGNFLQTKTSNTCMIIESVNITTDIENGNYMTVSGRSVECLLERRIAIDRTNYSMSLGGFMNNLLNYNFINPNDSDRKIDIIDSDITIGLDTVRTQLFGDNIYEVIVNTCKAYGYGFRMPLIDGKFTFQLYVGKDRTLSQKENTPAMFSSDFENLINTSYSYSLDTSKNIALVAGEGEGYDRRTVISYKPGISPGKGMDRYELFVDARDLTSKNQDGSEIGVTEYGSMLFWRGVEKLSEYANSATYDGECTNFPDYVELGDIVQIKNEFGMTATSRVIEIIESDSTSGYTKIPTFEEWSVNE